MHMKLKYMMAMLLKDNRVYIMNFLASLALTIYVAYTVYHNTSWLPDSMSWFVIILKSIIVLMSALLSLSILSLVIIQVRINVLKVKRYMNKHG